MVRVVRGFSSLAEARCSRGLAVTGTRFAKVCHCAKAQMKIQNSCVIREQAEK